MKKLLLSLTFLFCVTLVSAQTTGCTDSIAYNYDSSATLDDGSCSYCDYMDNDYISDLYYSEISCNGSNDGSIFGIDLGTSILYNGTGPFTYSVDSGLTFQSSTTFSNLSPGNYYITYMDANGCINPNLDLYWLPLFNPDSMQFTTSQNDVSCNGGNDGNMMIDVQYVNYYPYNLQWSDGSTDSVMNNVTAGNYNVVITDANNCTDTVEFNISEAIEISTLVSTFNVSCVGGTDGSASISSSGGTLPFTYLWSDGQSGNTATNLSEGSYQVFITDSANCLDTAYFSIGSSTISISISTTNVSCNGNDGAADVSVSGGTAPYSYAWYFEYPGYGYVPASSQEDISNGLSGTYFVVVTDANGCSVNSDTITLIVDDVLINTSTSDVSCNGGNDGSIDVFVTGGLLPYTYSWSNGSNTEDLINITAANYSITVTDANNCSIIESYVVNEPAQLNVSAILNPVTTDCDGSIDLSVNGGTQPFSFAWQLPSSSITDSFSVTSASSTASHPYYSYGPFQVYEIDGVQGAELTLIRGETYYFTMDNIPFFHPFYISTDMFGGQGGSFVGQVTAGVSNLDALGTYSATAYQTLSFTPDSSHSDTLFYQCGNHMYMGYRLIIIDGITSEDLTNLCEGTYDLTVTDANNCIVSESYFISDIIIGCTNPNASNYNPQATQDDGSCIIFGCIDSNMINYNATANTDDGSCIAYIYGCTDSLMFNFDVTANTDDSSCIPTVFGCMDSTQFNYNTSANTDDGGCIPFVFGCMDSTQFNYNVLANTDDGSCIAITFGCIDATAFNYDVTANTDDGSCTYCINGCTDSTAINYNALATCDDGTCIPTILGCTDSTAANFNPLANIDDGSCSVCADNYVNIQIITANYGSEVAWELVDENGSVVADGGCQSFPGNCYNSNTTYDNWLCIPTACYSLNLYDMFGDGWSGGTYTILDANGTTYAYGTLSSGSSSTISNIGIPFCSVLGCTDASATNYNPLANTDDGSCYNIQCVEVLPYSDDLELGSSNNHITLTSGSNASSSVNGYAANDGNYGWHGEAINVWGGGTPSSGQNAFNTKPDNIATLNVCVDLDAIVYNPSDIYHLKFDLKQEYSYNANYSWFRVQADNAVISDNNGNAYFQPNTPTSDSWQEIIYDVTSYVSMGVFDFDFQTCNKYSYGSFNNGDNGYVDNILIYKVVSGCTDSTMYNYNALANTDDGSCSMCFATANFGVDTIIACDSVTLSIPYENGCSYNWSSTNIIQLNQNVQTHLNNGIQPFDLFNAGYLLNDLYDKTYKGGQLYHLDTISGNGMVYGGGNGYSGIWGDRWIYTGATGANIGDGLSNTNLILAAFGNDLNTAAYRCDTSTKNGYTDWFLASSGSMAAINNRISGGATYWSSTECGSGNPWGAILNLYNGFCGHRSHASNNQGPGILVRNFAYLFSYSIDSNSTIIYSSGWNYINVVDSFGCTATDSVYVIIDTNCVYGCTDMAAINYDATSNVDDGSCTYLISGCTDPLADNYDATATNDDGSCTYSSVCNEDAPTAMFVDGIVHTRAVINWDNMNSSTCTVDQYRIRFKEVGTSSWTQKTMGGPVGSCTWGNQKTDKLLLNLTASTTYEYEMKAWYCGGGSSAWTGLSTFTTLDNCPNVGNLAAVGANPTKATFTWDASNGVYAFVRLKARVDSISNASGSDFFQIGGAGVSYGTYTKDKNGLVPGETYRGQARSYCDPNGGAWKSVTWTSLVYWTQPVVRVEGGTAIANLAIYPNPSRDVFNISFTSETVQDLKVRILNVVGEVIISEDLDQFIGEYTKQINLNENAKGIYFLEIETNDGVVNKKLILQ